jgi:long-chain fatty acid transport protein
VSQILKFLLRFGQQSRVKERLPMKFRHQLILAFLSFGCIWNSASAQDFYRTSASARSEALGGVYIPSSSDAIDALATNPAGLTYLSGRSLDLSLETVFPRGSFSNSANNGAQLGRTPGVLPYGAFGMPIHNSRFSFALGFVPDLMSVAHWNYVDAPGVAGATYGQQEQKSAILAGRAIAGLGVRLGRKVSVGVTVGSDYNSNTLDAPYIFQSQPVLKGLKTLLDLHTTGYGWNGSAGVLVRPTRKVEIGFAWKSNTVIESHGDASGNVGAQFSALGLTGVPADFHYSAEVRNVLPQSALASINWRATPRWLLAVQTDWINWENAFTTLAVTLTNGTNGTINGLVNSNSLTDGVPVDWKDQYSFHIGAERLLTERSSIRFGYAHANNPVPSSTLTPLTAAIMANQISMGFVYHRGRSTYDAAYSFDPTAQAGVQQSKLLSGEYSNSTVRVGIQSVALNYSFRF